MSGSYFNNAHDLHIETLTISNQSAIASKAFDCLYDNIATDAVHNSDERCNAPKCHAETRRAVQQDIMSWILNGDDDTQPKKILWLSGPAGAGKTAIAGSIAEACDDGDILAGSFFFSSFAGSETRCSKRSLIATLAYCLLQHDDLQPLREPILSAIDRDPFVFRKSLSAQCKALLLRPLQKVGGQLLHSSLPKVIIIDGLDEVGAPNSQQLAAHKARLANEADQVEILSALLYVARDPNFPFRILIVSRPEPAIRNFFSNKAGHITRKIFLDNHYHPDADIELFLKAKFTEIRRRYNLPLSWPGKQAFETLQDRASGQFIYAATVIRFLETSRMPPIARLDCVLNLEAVHPAGEDTPLLALDALYSHILMSSPDPPLSVRWLAAIAYIGDTPAFFVRQLLQEYQGQADYLLENLASLVFIPPIDDDQSPFRLYHKSLIDFMWEPKRCGRKFWDSFRGGVDFVSTCCAQVFTAKTPTVCLTDSEWQTFIPQFLQLETLSYSIIPPDEGDLAACDVQWWVQTVHATFSSLHIPAFAGKTIGRLFCAIHYKCPGYAACRPSCKYWRSNILAGCKALQWRVPNAITLLRYRMGVEVGVKPEDAWEERLVDEFFDPPSAVVGTHADPVFPSRDAPVLTASDEDYASMCDLADLMYSHLPDDWKELYQEELKDGKSPYSVLQSEIGEITREMGIDDEA